MNTSFIILGVLQAIFLFTYRWVGMVFISQPKINHPRIFWNPTSRLVLCYGPLAMMAVLVALAFMLTESPWLFLGLTVAGLIAFSSRPNTSTFM